MISPQVAESRFQAIVSEAKGRIREAFGVQVQPNEEAAALIEGLVNEMWAEGWNPGTGDINLFVRDFGSLFTAGIRATLGGTLVFRSETDLSHLSVWWARARLEAFPFHKVYKRLYTREGESLVYLVKTIGRRVSQDAGLRPPAAPDRRDQSPSP
jgi:hypothetical protein